MINFYDFCTPSKGYFQVANPAGGVLREAGKVREFSPVLCGGASGAKCGDHAMTDLVARLDQELEALRLVSGERVAELQLLADLPRPVAAAARLETLRKDHAIALALLHARYRTALSGPMAGVPPLDDQVALLQGDPLFDAQWYSTANPDVTQAGIDPARHYVTAGAFEGRAAGPDFDSAAYYRANPDVAQAGWPALVHYLLAGRAAGRALA